MHVDALDRHAHLPGMIIAALGDWLDDRVEIGASVDDDGGDAPMLERAARSRREDLELSPTTFDPREAEGRLWGMRPEEPMGSSRSGVTRPISPASGRW